MHIQDVLAEYPVSISFEFFPPKTEASREKLYQNIAELIPLKPASVSVTYGAGGSTRELTQELVLRLHRETELEVTPHLTCVLAEKQHITELVDGYVDAGVDNILALRGDPPQDYPDYDPQSEDFPFAADLVSFLRQRYPKLCIGVAGFPEGHPATTNRLKEIEHLKAKVDAGADYIMTQLFFDNRDFYDFYERCRLAGIDVPIIAGIMPLRNRQGMQKMADLAAGSRFPAELLKRVQEAPDDEAVEQVGMAWAVEQVRDLLNQGVDGLHFYTLNTAGPTLEIFRRLGAEDCKALAAQGRRPAA